MTPEDEWMFVVYRLAIEGLQDRCNDLESENACLQESVDDLEIRLKKAISDDRWLRLDL